MADLQGRRHAGAEPLRGLGHAHRTLVVQGSAAAEVDLPPPPGRDRARRGAPVPPGAQDPGRPRRRPFTGRGALPGPARDGRARAAEGRGPGHARHPLAHGFRRRRALRGAQPPPHARPGSLRGGHDRPGDRDDRDALQHARCAGLPAVPGAGSRQRGHAGRHLARQRLRSVLLSRVPRHPRPDEELRRSDRQYAAADRRLQRAARRRGRRERRAARLRQLLPRARRRADARTRVPGRRRPGARPRRRGGPFGRLLEARVRGRPRRRRPARPLERKGFHGHRRAAGKVHGPLHLRPPRVLHAARDGTDVLGRRAEGLLRRPRRPRAHGEGAPEARHHPAAGATTSSPCSPGTWSASIR